ncbi:hypothetical protein F5141DRAFT_216097 [Pisolithus sp. B1]|nr:hypothetical protein F5141DRAFT_216097 [Pisolithus sp. B1]
MHQPHANHMSVQRRRIQSCFTFFLHITLCLCAANSGKTATAVSESDNTQRQSARRGMVSIVVDFAAADLLGICIQCGMSLKLSLTSMACHPSPTPFNCPPFVWSRSDKDKDSSRLVERSHISDRKMRMFLIGHACCVCVCT